MFIVCWHTIRERDHYETAETMAEARAIYERVTALATTHSAAICAVVESTDYEPATLGQLAKVEAQP